MAHGIVKFEKEATLPKSLGNRTVGIRACFLSYKVGMSNRVHSLGPPSRKELRTVTHCCPQCTYSWHYGATSRSMISLSGVQ